MWMKVTWKTGKYKHFQEKITENIYCKKSVIEGQLVQINSS